MGKTTNRIIPETLVEFNAASLTAAFQSGNGGFSTEIHLIRITNASTANVTVSFDGITDHDFIPGTVATIPRNIIEINVLTNTPQLNQSAFAKGTIIYFKGTAGVGSIYIAAYGHGVRGQ